MAYGSISADTITSSTGQVFSPASSIMRNRIINGAMVIDQRNAGASVTPTAEGYTLDRWKARLSQSSKYSVQQVTTAPAGFNNSIKVTSLSAYTVGSGELFCLQQPIEGYNIADLGFGSANAKTITVSFWVQSSLTGTFGGALNAPNGTRSYPFSYTISSANTWTQISITVAGDTTGTYGTTNGEGFSVFFSLGTGSTLSGTAGSWSGSTYVSVTGATSVVGTSGATFYITGVQLEAGSVASQFEYRQYGTELQLCQRYYQQHTTGAGVFSGSSVAYISHIFYVTMRSSPTTSLSSSGTLKTWYYSGANQSISSINAAPYGSFGTIQGYTVAYNLGAGSTGGQGTSIYTDTSPTAYVAFSSEL